MIHDPTISVTCDNCGDTGTITPDYRYTSYSGEQGYYDTSDSAIEKLLRADNWIVIDGKHFCNLRCQREYQEAQAIK